MKLGFLDIQGAIEDTIELAPLADALGYTRYWMTEFPPQPSPITIAVAIAGTTDRIRVGSAAILLNYYAPKRTAHDFQLLERLFEGRIDAGVCSSTAAQELVADDLDGRDPGALHEGYSARFTTFLRNLRNTPDDSSYAEAVAWRGAPAAPPQVWSLGQRRSAELAAAHGTRFGYPLMYAHSVDDPAAVEAYRAQFVPYHPGDRPFVAVAVCGVCAETDDAARALARPGVIFVPRVVGSGQTCATQLAALRERYGADEMIFADMTPGTEARRRSLEVLAAAAAACPGLA